MKKYSIEELKKEFSRLGYSWPSGIHIVGVRNKAHVANTFDDLLIQVWNSNALYGLGTTVPGSYWLKNLMNPKGTAVLKEGQYLNCWKVGTHHTYQALIQVLPITVYRDVNKDDKIDKVSGTEDKGLFGINIHRAGQNFIAKFIDNFSAGCQVWDDPKVFDRMLSNCISSGQLYFSYTLLNEF